MAGLGDLLAHAYFGLEDETIWQVVSMSVPALALLAAELDRNCHRSEELAGKSTAGSARGLASDRHLEKFRGE